MSKTILITGSTDGIGFETAKSLLSQGHRVLIHGRSENKLSATASKLRAINSNYAIETYCADLSSFSEVEKLAAAVSEKHSKVDVLINNAGVFVVPNPLTENGLDVRFVVNTIAPWLLTQRLLALIPSDGRVVNLSSAAQAPVDLQALVGRAKLDSNQAYAQSKLALTMWSSHLANSLGAEGPAIIAVNPASFLGSKMVKEAYGSNGNDLQIGADILSRAAISEEFAHASGRYFDNDQRRFASPHPDALDATKNKKLVDAIESLLQP